MKVLPEDNILDCTGKCMNTFETKSCLITFATQTLLLTSLNEKYFENILGKGENTLNLFANKPWFLRVYGRIVLKAL